MKVMNYKIKYLLLIMIVLSVAGCQKDNIMVFDVNDSGVMFPGAGDTKLYKGYNAADQTYYVNESFLNVPMTQNTYIVDFPVRVSGDSVNKDRIVAYEILTEETSALSTQYKIVDALIPAGKQYGRIRFELTRDVALDNASVKVSLMLKDSKDFKVGSIEYKKGVLTWSNMLAKFPASSSYTRTYNCIILSPLTKTSTVITYYSPNAHKAILEALGWPITYWPTYTSGFADPNTGTSAIYGVYYTDLYAQKLKTYLDAYAEANGGVRLKHNAGTDIGKDIQPRITGAVYIP
jgi:hypothetical protein